MRGVSRHHVVVVFVAVTLALSVIPGIAHAQTGGGGTIIVEEGESVSEISALAGSVTVRGTVTGDVSVMAGNIHIAERGTVQGDLSGAAGNVRIDGTVDGDVSAGAGNVHVTESGVVGGNFGVGAGTVLINGTIQGDATIGAETIRLGEAAVIAGSLTYDGTLEGNRDAVQGTITRDPSRRVGVLTDIQPFASIVVTAYAFVINLILGAILLYLFPRFSKAVATRVTTDPIRVGLIGLGVLILIPVLLIALAITVIGIPLTIVGAFTFVLVAWVALVYGRFAVGAWVLSFAAVDNKWAALVVGLLIGAILALIPFVGGLLNFVIFLLGLGALSRDLYAHQRRTRAAPASGPVDETLGG